VEILYIYFKDHYLFAGQNFNFGGKFLFQYDIETNTLDISENQQYISGFYDQTSLINKGNTVNLTGIIAENGAGKTTFINFIRDNFPWGKGGIQHSIIFAYENNGERVLVHFDDLPILNNIYEAHGFHKKTMGIKINSHPTGMVEYPNLEYRTFPKADAFENTEFIYFSNIFDGQLSKESHGLKDVSTNYLLREGLNDDIVNKRISRSFKYNEVDTFIFQDIERQINYINNYKGVSKLPLRLPEFLIISAKRNFTELDISLDSEDLQTLEKFGFKNIVQFLFDKAKRLIDEKSNWETKAKVYFAKATLVNFLMEIATSFTSTGLSFGFDFNIRDLESKSDYFSVVDEVLRNLETTFRNFYINMSETLYQEIRGVENFIKNIQNILKEDNIVNSDGTSFWLNIHNESDNFRTFYKTYLESYRLKPFLQFSWEGMSSGEIAFLNIFSRFYSVIHNYNRLSSKLPKNLIVLIDEGDTYLHPTWQKKFIKDILEYLPVIFENRNIQIIFTTNSPIPASDLPNSNIIFLEKDGKKVIVRKSLEDKKLTFGTNINSLLSDSFFLKDGTLGDFAKTKINHVIEILQKNKLSDDESNYVKKVINIIGEPIVKSKLLQMLSDKMTIDLIGVNNRLNELEEEIKLLKQRG